MPNRPIDFKFTSDVVALLNGLGKAELSVEDLEQAFVTASNSSADLEKKINKATREAEKDVDKLVKAVKEVPDATEAAADEAAKDFDRIGDDARQSIGAAGGEAGSEFRQNLGESLASGGSLQDILTDTVGGLIASMPGPAGAAAGIVGGAALLVFNQVKQHAEEMKAAVEATFTGMWDNVVDSTDAAFGKVQAEINVPALVSKEFTRLWEDDPVGMQKLVEQAEKLGIAAGDIVLARAGDAAAIERVRAALDETVAGTGMNIEGARKWSEEIGDVADAVDQGEQALKQTQATTDAYNRSVSALPAVWGSVEDAIEKTATNAEGLVSETDKARLIAADINADGFLDDTEVAAANLQDVMTKAGLIPDPGMPTTRTDAEAIQAAILAIPTEVRVKVLDESAVVNKTATGYTSTAYMPRARAGEAN